MFQYRWLEAALDNLAIIYVAADPAERERMAAGVEAFNARLAADPLDVGESRVGRESGRISAAPEGVVPRR